ncbi:glycoside hydrolase family 18 protein [Zasmidium cellare ATCC 36951]|uniref:chitinase n=1 Tax=Zasmidium cellare ATCC 36951 TaxID=1080233 RepID=A0A6A6CM79_ZASCE|nr:glycoside hydrolase family 18 protein [Zasmidium cellare ATCC 36951]KAF2167032.1 glycoside hydrolase family 18 protein [Zasmidium cellare ATCC 36951]
MRLANGLSSTSISGILLNVLLEAQVAKTQFVSAISPCPIECDPSGSNPSAWTYYYGFDELNACDGTVIFETNIYNNVTNTKHLYYRACTATGGTVLPDGTAGVKSISDRATVDPARGNASSPSLARRQVLSLNDTTPAAASLQLVSGNNGGDADIAAAQAALDGLGNYIATIENNASTIFARSKSMVAGAYIGSQLDKSSAAAAISKFHDRVGQNSAPSEFAAQSCGTADKTVSADYFGVIYDTSVLTVGTTLRSWDQAGCITGDQSQPWDGVQVQRLSGTRVSIAPEARSILVVRATCNYTQVESGDGCYSVAERCGISQDQLESYNGSSAFCSSLTPDEYACCSAGSLPDFSPQQNPDGSCISYTIQPDDYCAAIAEAHQMTTQDIKNRNNQTWGWQGCGNLFVGMKICLSTGIPPFPANVPNSVCGPQVNNTQATSEPTTWADLNPCPLNACCDIFGQCGITPDFCTADPADTGNPGTAQPGSNGCISNCGTDIISGPPPATFERVASIPERYTIVHWAFANISDSFEPSVTPYEDGWAKFKDQTGFKRVVSFGGWTFSTAGSMPDNRQTFANNLAAFVQNEGIDGIDIDWEYPGAPDDEGEDIPIDSPDSGPNYLAFLKLLRAALPSQCTVSISLPASYYYSKAFPVKDMAPLLDYFIYMTYDLHGQWDYGNKFTNPGCPNDNCLRSQINHTETASALSMLTKAGVPANKIMLGQPLYGRSFQMSQADCITPECTFTGPASGALPGNCTETPGYLSNTEILSIINGGQYSVQQYETTEAGDILVYDDTQWVSWMKGATYDSRSEWAQALGFAGTSDWAIDLNVTGGEDGGGGGGGTGGGSGSGVVSIDPSVYSGSPTVSCQPPCTFVFPPWTLPYTTTITPSPVTTSITEEWPLVTTLSGMVTTTYSSDTTITFPPITTTEVPVSNVEWTDTNAPVFTLTSSVLPPPATLSQESTVVTTSGTTKTIPGIYYVFSLGPYPPPATPTSGQTSTTPAPPPPTGCPFCPPSITGHIGPPGPICIIGCGSLGGGGGGGGGGGCGRPNCNDCIGVGCSNGGDCVGPGCGDNSDDGSGGDGGDNPDDPDDPDDPESSCSSSSTVTDCSVDCNVGPDSDESTYTTSCFSTSCSDHVGCRATGSTTTEETTTACASEPPYTASFGPNGQIPMMGGGGDAGTILVPGYIGANPTYDPSNTGGTGTPTGTSTSTNPPDASATISLSLYSDLSCQNKSTTVTLTSLDVCTNNDIGFMSMLVDSSKGLEDHPTLNVYPDEFCQADPIYQADVLSASCLNEFTQMGGPDECGDTGCTIFYGIEWTAN